ncbi:MAG TPA: FxsA family protein [Actinocatenispora sp.]
MRPVALALLLPVATALVELGVLFAVAQLIGIGWALLILLATTLVGAYLIRRVGPRAWRRFRGAVDAGRAPGAEATDGLLSLAGALLIAFPGFLTDLVGAALFVPPVRAAVGRLVERSVTRRLSPEVAGQMFGPRKVRVRQSDPDTADDAPLEGEIIEPR